MERRFPIWLIESHLEVSSTANNEKSHGPFLRFQPRGAEKQAPPSGLQRPRGVWGTDFLPAHDRSVLSMYLL